MYDIALVGGDKRVAYMAAEFRKKGYRVIGYGLADIGTDLSGTGEEGKPADFVLAGSLREAVKQSRVVVSGIPLMKDGQMYCSKQLPDLNLRNLCETMTRGQTFFAGVIPQEMVAECEKREVRCMDFMKDEALAVFNAIATAEGTILEALMHKNTNLHGSSSLVLGYGRCAAVLADKLKGMGANVTVCARSKVACARADAMGFKTILLDKLEDKIVQYEYIFNTVPAVILTRQMLERTQPAVLIIDIASGQGGVDYEAAGQMGIATLKCPGLPGKYAPKISAKGLVDVVIQT